jgi:hypothetical protein
MAAIPPPIYIIQSVIATNCASCAHCTIQKDGQALVYDLHSEVNAEVGLIYVSYARRSRGARPAMPARQ